MSISVSTISATVMVLICFSCNSIFTGINDHKATSDTRCSVVDMTLNGKLSRTDFYTNNVLDSQRYYYDGHMVYLKHIFIAYTPEFQELKRINPSTGEILDIQCNWFDSNGRIVKQSAIDKDGIETYVNVYTYTCKD